MRWTAAAVVVMALAVSGSSQETTKGWVKYSSEDANVAILFPGNPKVNDTPNGGKEVLFESKDGSIAYMLRFDPFPMKIDPTDSDITDKIFDGVKSGLKKSGGTIKKEKEFKINKKYPVLELDSSAKAIPDHKIRVIITEKWLIQVHAGGPKGTPASEDAQLFLNSFLLKE